MHDLVDRLRRLSFEIAYRKMRKINNEVDEDVFKFVSSLCYGIEEYQWLFPTTASNLWQNAILAPSVRKFITGLFTEFRLRALGEDAQWDALVEHFANAYSQLNDSESVIGKDFRNYIPLSSTAQKVLAGNPWLMPLILISTFDSTTWLGNGQLKGGQ